MLEVKSSFSDSKSIANYVKDLAFTTLVIQLSGLAITKCSLLLLSREYVYGANTVDLFKSVDKTDEVLKLVNEVKSEKDGLANDLLGEEKPAPVLASPCRSCNFFSDICLGRNLGHSVLEIPDLHHTKLKKLSESGIINLKDFPADMALNEKQERAISSAINNKIFKAEALIDILGKQGSIIVYSSFENVRIGKLAESYPDIRDELLAINDRMVDLLKLIRTNIYHPEFKGSFSIKTVLPVLVPEMSYKGLSVGDGDTAIALFAKMAMGKVDDVEGARNSLLAYCEMDTLAMVKLHNVLAEFANE